MPEAHPGASSGSGRGGSGRLDLIMVERGLASTRGRAQQLIAAGSVWVGTGERRRTTTRPAYAVGPDEPIEVVARTYVSRAAGKLSGALDDLDLTPAGRALDAGASTGGFTQVLLERGATRVYAVDVGHDQLAPAVRADPRVRAYEGLHLRDLTLSHLDGRRVDWVVADVSFVSLTKIIAPLAAVVTSTGSLLLLVKPQFEVGRAGLDRHGVVRDPRRHAEAVEGVIAAAETLGWRAHAVVPSRVVGPAGNQEYFVWFRSTPADRLDDRSGLRSHHPGGRPARPMLTP